MTEELSADGWVDVHIASAILGVSENTVRAMAREGVIPSVNVGRGVVPRWKFRRQDLRDWLASRSNVPRGTSHETHKRN